MSLHRASAALLILSAVLAGAPAASADTATAAATDIEASTAGVGTGTQSFLCTYMGLFC